MSAFFWAVLAAAAMTATAAVVGFMIVPVSHYSPQEGCHLSGGAWVEDGRFCVRRQP